MTMMESSDFRTKRLPLGHTAGRMPVLGFGTLIPDAALTISATRDALEAGFRHFDCAERYQNEREVGQALRAQPARGKSSTSPLFRRDALNEINAIQTRQRFNDVVNTGSPGFIPQGR
jgi:alcohol dehydrogenase (NADP+)